MMQQLYSLQGNKSVWQPPGYRKNTLETRGNPKGIQIYALHPSIESVIDKPAFK